MASRASSALFLLSLHSAALVAAQAACYYAAGAQYRIPDSAGVVPCNNEATSQCCRLGDICLEGNACYDATYGDTYQYGCSDITYKDASCPFKCGWDPDLSPWVAIEYCAGYNGINNTWNCQSPESCGCEWRATYDLLTLPPRECTGMGNLARVAIYASDALSPWAVLPTTSGGSIVYYSSGVAVTGYTPSSIGPTASLAVVNKIIQYDSTATPLPSVGTAVLRDGAEPPSATLPTSSPSSDILGGSGSGYASSTAVKSTTPTAKTSGTSSPHKTSSSSSGGATTTTSPSTNPSGLSTDAKVGLGVGIAGGVCLLSAILLAAMVLRKRRNAKATEAATVYKHDKPPSDSADAYYDPYNRGPNVQEAPYTPHEEARVWKRMDPHLNGAAVPELDSKQQEPVYEMDSGADGQYTPTTAGTEAPRGFS